MLTNEFSSKIYLRFKDRIADFFICGFFELFDLDLYELTDFGGVWTAFFEDDIGYVFNISNVIFVPYIVITGSLCLS